MGQGTCLVQVWSGSPTVTSKRELVNLTLLFIGTTVNTFNLGQGRLFNFDCPGAVSRLSRGEETRVLVPAWGTHTLKEVNQVKNLSSASETCQKIM